MCFHFFKNGFVLRNLKSMCCYERAIHLVAGLLSDTLSNRVQVLVLHIFSRIVSKNVGYIIRVD
jgi:hypothetical protein